MSCAAWLVLLLVPALARDIPSLLNRPFNDAPIAPVTFERYNTVKEIEAYVETLGREFPKLVTLDRIGQSVQGRPITAIKISSHSRPFGSSGKPVILVDAGIHAREWIAPAAALYTLTQLVENYKQNKELVDNIDWIVVPLINPDGYHYSMVEDRLWRKNRANNSEARSTFFEGGCEDCEDCEGVDLNRNFDVSFGGRGTSNDPCEEIYAGPHAFSEPESRAIRDLALKYKNKIRMYLTLHSYGQYFLYPWGYNYDLPKDWRDLEIVAKKAEQALSSVYGTRYKIGSSGRLMGAAAGGSDDWMKREGGAKYSYTIELPGGGSDGFDLPEEDIMPVVEELFPALRVFARHVFTEHLNSS